MLSASLKQLELVEGFKSMTACTSLAGASARAGTELTLKLGELSTSQQSG